MSENTLDLDNTPEVETQAPPVEAQPAEESVGSEVVEENSEVQESVQESEDRGDELPKGVKKRLSKLTQQKYEQQARIEALEREKQELAQKFEASAKSKADFHSEDEWVDYKVQQKLDARFTEQQLEAQRQNLAAEQVRLDNQMWNERVESFKEVLPDFAEVVGSSQANITEDVVQFLQTSPQGPALTYELAKNPQLAQDLQYMDARSRDRELMRMEFALGSRTPAARPAAPITNAQPIPKANNGTGGVTNPSDMSMADFVKWRNRQLGR